MGKYRNKYPGMVSLVLCIPQPDVECIRMRFQNLSSSPPPDVRIPLAEGNTPEGEKDSPKPRRPSHTGELLSCESWAMSLRCRMTVSAHVLLLSHQ